MILPYLDKELENFKMRTGNYPAKIMVNKKIYDKIFAELEEYYLDNCWKEKGDNYRGIELVIDNNIERINLE